MSDAISNGENNGSKMPGGCTGKDCQPGQSGLRGAGGLALTSPTIEAAKRPCLTNKPKRLRKPKPPPDDALGALNHRQRKFLAEYLSNGGNATRAAEAAGYSPSKSYFSAAVQANALLKNPKIRAAIEASYRVAGMTVAEVVARLVEQARANPTQFFDKRWRLNRHVLRRKGHLVKRLEVPARGKPAKIELHDAQAALVLIGKHLGLFSDKVQHVGDQGGPVRHEFVVCVPEAALA